MSHMDINTYLLICVHVVHGNVCIRTHNKLILECVHVNFSSSYINLSAVRCKQKILVNLTISPTRTCIAYLYFSAYIKYLVYDG